MANFRWARSDDYRAIASLNAQVFKLHAAARPDLLRMVDTPMERARFEEMLLSEQTRILVMEDEQAGGILGFAALRLEQAPDKPVLMPRKTVYIADLGVDENIRGRGLGSALLRHVIELAKQWGADDVELQVSEFNEGAIRLYEKFGFRTKTRKMELILQESDRSTDDN